MLVPSLIYDLIRNYTSKVQTTLLLVFPTDCAWNFRYPNSVVRFNCKLDYEKTYDYLHTRNHYYDRECVVFSSIPN